MQLLSNIQESMASKPEEQKATRRAGLQEEMERKMHSKRRDSKGMKTVIAEAKPLRRQGRPAAKLPKIKSVTQKTNGKEITTIWQKVKELEKRE